MKSSTYTWLIAMIALVFASLACGGSRVTTTDVDSPTRAPILSTLPPSTAPAKTYIDLRAGSYSSYTDSIGSLWFVGEVVNDGNEAAESVEVALSLLDASGKVIGVGSSFITYIDANGKFPFNILILNPPASWQEVKVQIQGTPSSAQLISLAYTDLAARDISGQPNGYGGYSLTGTVANTGQKTATLVHVVAAAYDSDGKVIDVGETFTTLSEIAPGGDSPFSLDFSNLDSAPPSYEVFVVSFSN